ncbi:polysaccharide chain length determinant protein (PEP-CTERM system associated) [Azospirillum canadense]|nr:polysaccharide chain length determinant protein (PEP-CTERM system associated) [Azospirillum canadense]
MLMPDRYESNARIYVDTDTLITPLMRGLTVQTDPDRQIDIMRKTLLTRPNLEQVIRKTDLDLRAKTPADLERLIDTMQRKLKVVADGKGLFQISYWDADALLTQRVVQIILNQFVEQNVGKSRADMDNAQRFLDNQINAFEKRLRETEERVAEFRRTHANELGGRQGLQSALEMASVQLRQLQQERDAAVWNRDQIRLELARTPQQTSQERGPGGAPLSRTAEMERQLALLRATRTDDHPDVVNLRRQIAAAKSDPARPQSGGTVRTVSADNPAWNQLNLELRKMDGSIATLERRIKDSATLIGDLRKQIDEVPGAETELQQLQRDYDVVKTNYTELLVRRESARMARSLEDQTKTVQFRIIEPPVLARIPEGPPRVALFAAVLAAAIGAGVGLVVLLYLMRNPFSNPASLSEAYGLRVLGAISELPNPGARVRTVTRLSTFGSATACLIGAFLMLAFVYSSVDHRPDLRGTLNWLKGSIQAQLL